MSKSICKGADCPECRRDDWYPDAIATEAGTAETGTGSVHKGAGLQGIAKTPPPAPIGGSDNG